MEVIMPDERRAGKKVANYNPANFMISLACCGLLFMACSPRPGDILEPLGDIRPPSILDAGQTDAASFTILFDEDIIPISERFAFTPTTIAAEPSVQGSLLKVRLNPGADPGGRCELSGEVKDSSGNCTRFLFSFLGYNATPASIRLQEIQTCKNTSASNFHRDYIELYVQGKGNLGGVRVQWLSTVKTLWYAFPPCEVQAGEIILLHCSPEGIPEEKDETGQDLSLSGGVDSSPIGRDFWSEAGGIPDETGLILVRTREAGAPIDGFFYASLDKTGALDSPRIIELLNELNAEGLWVASDPPVWDDAFRWKSSSSKPFHRGSGLPSGIEAWSVGESGSQSPGRLLAGQASKKAGNKALRKEK